MKTVLETAQLYLNDTHVGTVLVHGRSNSWGIGQFRPNAQFSAFAMLFGEWSLLMHADGEDQGLSHAASEELARVESAIDALHARLHLTASDRWQEIGQINIDGDLIEWKERYTAA